MSVCTSVPYMNALCLRGPEEGVGSPGCGVMDGYEPSCGCWEQNMGLLEEQRAVLTAESSSALIRP